MLQKALEGASEAMEEEDDDEGKSVKKSRFSDLTPEDLEQLGIDAETLEALAAEQGDNLEEEDDDDDSEESNGEEEESDGEDIDLGEGIAQLRDHESEPPLKSVLSRNPKSKKGSYSKLDDGFFDLASFNAETEEAEAKHVSGGRLGSNLEDEDDSESDVDSVDYFAAVNGVEAFETGGPTESGEFSAYAASTERRASLQRHTTKNSSIRHLVALQNNQSHLQSRRRARFDSTRRLRSKTSKQKGNHCPSTLHSNGRKRMMVRKASCLRTTCWLTVKATKRLET